MIILGCEQVCLFWFVFWVFFKTLCAISQVQWKYQTANGFEAYEPEINALIEEAYMKKKPSILLDLEEGRMQIDFRLEKEVSTNGTVDIRRVDMGQGRA